MVIAPPFIAEAPSAGDNTPSSAIRDLLTNLPGMPATAGGLLVLAASLALYVAGLFSSIRGDADRAS
jgi:hypothetical protein